MLDTSIEEAVDDFVRLFENTGYKKSKLATALLGFLSTRVVEIHHRHEVHPGLLVGKDAADVRNRLIHEAGREIAKEILEEGLIKQSIVENEGSEKRGWDYKVFVLKP